MIHTWNRFDDEDDCECLLSDLMIEHHGDHFGVMWSNDPQVLKSLREALEKSDRQIGIDTLAQWREQQVQAMLSE
jgi:hypothetical protein